MQIWRGEAGVRWRSQPDATGASASLRCAGFLPENIIIREGVFTFKNGNCLKVPCSYSLIALGKFALLRYLSEF